MEWLAVGLGVALVVLAGLLSVLAWTASERFRERRFLVVGFAFLIVAILAALATIAELGLGGDAFDETFALEPAPVALLIVALLLIYTAIVGPRRRSRKAQDGGRA